VAEQSRLHVLDAERLAQERVGLQIDLPDRQVVRRAPPSIDEVEVLSRFGHRTFQAWRAPRGATLPKHRQRPARFFRLSTRKLPTIKCSARLLAIFRAERAALRYRSPYSLLGAYAMASPASTLTRGFQGANQ
jgi:hypothetical protein